jgi:hypothetical protein
MYLPNACKNQSSAQSPPRQNLRELTKCYFFQKNRQAALASMGSLKCKKKQDASAISSMVPFAQWSHLPFLESVPQIKVNRLGEGRQSPVVANVLQISTTGKLAITISVEDTINCRLTWYEVFQATVFSQNVWVADLEIKIILAKSSFIKIAVVLLFVRGMNLRINSPTFFHYDPRQSCVKHSDITVVKQTYTSLR